MPRKTLMSVHSVVGLLLAVCLLFLTCLIGVRFAPVAFAAPMAQSTSLVATLPPTATPPAAGTPLPQEQTYTVEPGDTLWTIAQRFYGNGTKYTEIIRANDLQDNAPLRVGTVLILPVLSNVGPAQSPSSLLTATPTLFVSGATAQTPLAATRTSAPVPSVVPTAADLTMSVPKSSSLSGSPLVPYVQLALYTLSGICFLGSLFCAYLSLEAYRRSRRFIKRTYIRGRVRV